MLRRVPEIRGIVTSPTSRDPASYLAFNSPQSRGARRFFTRVALRLRSVPRGAACGERESAFWGSGPRGTCHSPSRRCPSIVSEKDPGLYIRSVTFPIYFGPSLLVKALLGPARPCAVLAASRGAESDGGSLASRALLSSPLLSRGRGRAGDRQALSLAAGAFPSAHVGPWAAAHALC